MLMSSLTRYAMYIDRHNGRRSGAATPVARELVTPKSQEELDGYLDRAFEHLKNAKIGGIFSGVSFATLIAMILATTHELKLGDTPVDKEMAAYFAAVSALLGIVLSKCTVSQVNQFTKLRTLVDAARPEPVNASTASSAMSVNVAQKDTETTTASLGITADNQAWLDRNTPRHLCKTVFKAGGAGFLSMAGLLIGGMVFLSRDKAADGTLGQDPATSMGLLGLFLTMVCSPLLCWMVERWDRLPQHQAVVVHLPPAPAGGSDTAVYVPLLGDGLDESKADGQGTTYRP